MASDEYKAAMAARDARKAQIAKRKADQLEREMVILDQLEQQHGDDSVRRVDTLAGMVVIRKPTKPEVDRFQDSILRDGKPQQKAQRIRLATEQLARICVLYPEGERYAEYCEEYGGIPAVVGGECAKLANVVYEEEAEK